MVSNAELSELSLCDHVCVICKTFETGHTIICFDKERLSASQVASKQCVNGQVIFDELWDPEESQSVAYVQRDQSDKSIYLNSGRWKPLSL